MISIVTINYNNLHGLKETLKSVVEQKKYFSDIEYVVIDGGSTDGSKEFLLSNIKHIDYFVSEKDDGIYDAMNKGIKAASGEYMLFLNSGDYFVGNVLTNYIESCCFLQVRYRNYFCKDVEVSIKSVYRGLPNCHQGIVFRNKGLLYDLTYSLASDYDYFIRGSKGEKYKKHKSKGYIYYDNEGVSSKNVQVRDEQIFDIKVKHFGYMIAVLFEIEPAIKRLIRRVVSRHG